MTIKKLRDSVVSVLVLGENFHTRDRLAIECVDVMHDRVCNDVALEIADNLMHFHIHATILERLDADTCGLPASGGPCRGSLTTRRLSRGSRNTSLFELLRRRR
jgi:hypothetical protein